MLSRSFFNFFSFQLVSFLIPDSIFEPDLLSDYYYYEPTLLPENPNKASTS